MNNDANTAAQNPTTESTEKKVEVRREKMWLPLESNPELMTKYMHKLGVPSDWEFHDVLGIDEDLLAMVPQPVSAVLLLFPITDASDAFDETQRKTILEKGQEVNKNVYFIKQTVGNACGTIGLIHAVANVKSQMSLEEGKFFAKFLAATADLTAEKRADALEANTDIEEEHQVIAADPNATSRVDDAENVRENQNKFLLPPVNLHFICFLNVEGNLYELDGRKSFPINHGPTSADTLLHDSAKIVSQFMARDPEEIRFNIVALAKSS